ncbi:peroxiredoxin [Saonia flava]|uniref:Peroxiredoxin n=1 Tax=Saonia flava TaxID=523696 RepID=A0A846QTB6_9FLAO|nr:redoxin domain-containing protein [Saonia flava]NJB69593.1 peroxiredoxin [Saonia flava]
MDKFLPFLCTFLLIGCSSVEKKSTSTVYFAGEIVNPTSNYVVLYKDDVVVDSAKLDSQNRFSFKLDSVNEGLHHFNHAPELQYVYFEKGDSILARLNTSDFDESLAFSGQGEEINNFLIDMFLTQEQEVHFIHSLYKLEPEVFSKKIDSLRNEKKEGLLDLQASVDLSSNAIEMAQASIDYNYYTFKEKYPFYHKRKAGEDRFHNLSENFYDYRKNISFNNKNLTYFRPYYDFMKFHYGNLSFNDCSHKCAVENGIVKNNLHFYQHKLKLIDSCVKQKDLRDNLFRNVAVDYLLKNDVEINNDSFIASFHKFSAHNKHIAEIDALYKNIKQIQPNKEIPDITLYNTNGQQVQLKDIASRNKVVFYFWSGTQKKHFDNITEHITKLNSKYLDYEFVGINVKTDNKIWMNMLDSKGLDLSKQYRAEDYTKIAHTMIVFDPNKAFIAQDGHIVDAFANLYTSF